MQLIYATKNSAQVFSMSIMLEGMDLDFTSILERQDLPDADETSNDPLEHATLTATTYFNLLRQPLFSCGFGLYIEGLPDEEQPGVHVRNVGGQRLNDLDMLEHYSGLARRMGGQCIAQYRNAICLILDEAHIIRFDGPELDGKRFFLTSERHPRLKQGFPLDSLSIDMDSGNYYFDIALPNASIVSGMMWGVRDFFRRALQMDQ